jgi:alpha-glucosidase (family GH31 glycosyl hydrolase)
MVACIIIIDYKLALKEYSLVGGRIPLPPRYAFGVFYSRYWAYNDIGEMVIFRVFPMYILIMIGC